MQFVDKNQTNPEEKDQQSFLSFPKPLNKATAVKSEDELLQADDEQLEDEESVLIWLLSF